MPFYITHAGWEYVRPKQAYPQPGQPRYYSFDWSEGRVIGEFCLWLVIKGEGELETKLGRQRARAGEAFLYKPGEWHRHRPDNSVGWSIIWIHFNGNLPHRWLTDESFQLEKNKTQIKNIGLFIKQFKYLVESVDASSQRNSLEFSWQSIGLLSHFLIDKGEGNSSQNPRSGDPVVDASVDYIWTQSHNQIGISDIAHHVGVNRRTLERHFKSATGSSVLSEVQRSRLSRAALMLRETDELIKNVLLRAGFPNYRSLRVAIEREFHMSPEKYRSSHANTTGKLPDS